MYRFYDNGEEFLKENESIFSRFPLETVFFPLNASLIKRADKNDFLYKANCGDKFLIAVHKDYYPVCIFGDDVLCAEFARAAFENRLTFGKTMGKLSTCRSFLSEYARLADVTYEINHSMDIMCCGKTLTEDAFGAEMPSENDVDNLAELIADFTYEALGESKELERVKEYVQANLASFAVIRSDGNIVSLASKKRETDKLCCIADVYTHPAYRNRGYSRKAVTKLTNDIIRSGKLAYLFVDKNNPVSNHLYCKIGYTYAVDQYEFKITRN